MNYTEKIKSKQEALEKINIRIASDTQRKKELEEEIERLTLYEIKSMAEEAKLPLPEVRSLLEDLLKSGKNGH